MPPLASHVADAAVGPPSAQVLAPLSTTSPTPLRRATYVKVCELAKPFSIDEDKLREQINMLEKSAAEAAENNAIKSSDPTSDAERSSDEEIVSAAKKEKLDAETTSTTAAITKLRIGGSKENVTDNQFQHQNKSSHKKLSPPSNGFNLCL